MAATVIPLRHPAASPDPVLQAGLAELFQFGLTIARVAKRFAEVEEGAINALAEAAANATRAVVATPTSLGSAIKAGTDADASEDARNAIAARLASITDSYDKAARAVRRTAALQARLAEARPLHNPAKDHAANPHPRPAAAPAERPANDAEPTDRPDWDDEIDGRTDEEVLGDIHRDLEPSLACLVKAPATTTPARATPAQPQTPVPPIAQPTPNPADALPEPDT